MKVDKKFNKEALKVHNALRKLHGCSPLIYDANLAIQAQVYAQLLAEKNKMVHSHLPFCGENLATRYSTEPVDLTATEASLMWYEEIVDYKFKGRNQKGCGHFTQLVWKDTKVAGFGVAKTADGHSVFVVGQYYPPGNVDGQYGSQVPYPLSRSKVVPTADALSRLIKSGAEVLVRGPHHRPVHITANPKTRDLQNALAAVYNEFRKNLGLPPLSAEFIRRYVLTSTAPGLPSLSSTDLGPTLKFAEFGLSCVSYTDPFIRTHAGELCVQLAYQQKLPLQWTAKLTFVTNDSTEDCSHMMLQQTRKKKVYFLLRFPRTGFFKLQLYALPANDHSDSLPNVYNYLLETSKSHRLHDQVMPFPKQFTIWTRGCYLKTPTEGILGLDDNGKLSSKPPHSLRFNVHVPNAIAVAVVVGEKWTQLGSEDGRWKGKVGMRDYWGKERKLIVCAKYAAKDTEYSTLLEYSLAM